MPRPQPTTFRYDEDAAGVATIRLDRPERLNALTFASYRELADTFRALDTRDEVRAVVLTGTGRAFCSGGDALEIIQPLLQMDAEQRSTHAPHRRADPHMRSCARRSSRR
jgi:enoyl-CoA hydratase/carnithine racemase